MGHLQWGRNARLLSWMKVLFFVRDLAVGGSQRQLAVTAAGLARRGHDVAVAVLYAGGALETLLHGSGARLLSVGKSSRWHVGAPLARLRQLFLSERPDLVYAFLPTQTTLAALLLPARIETKLVFGLRAGGMQFDRYDVLSALFYRTEVWLSRRADLVIANARAVRADAVTRGLPPDHIAVIPNGIDTETMRPDSAAGHAQRRAWGISADAFVIGCVGRLDPMKDHANLLTAAAGFVRRHGDAHFVLVGAGAPGYRDELRTLAHSLGVAERVVWAGEIGDVRAAYSAFDVATLSSAFGEGFPNVRRARGRDRRRRRARHRGRKRRAGAATATRPVVRGVGASAPPARAGSGSARGRPQFHRRELQCRCDGAKDRGHSVPALRRPVCQRARAGVCMTGARARWRVTLPECYPLADRVG
jgi:glycosyltransferase involved in cell wall biosynthesis